MGKAFLVTGTVLSIVFRLALFLFLYFLMKYPEEKKKTSPPRVPISPGNGTNITIYRETQTPIANSPNLYSLFQNVNAMVIIGFGFLMTYLKKYGRSSIGFSLLLSTFIIMWYIFLEGLIAMKKNHIILTIINLIRAEQAAVTVLISFGVVLGKLNILQYYFMAIFEVPMYAANKYLCEYQLLVADPGGSTLIHLFGSFFGLGVSLIQGLTADPIPHGTDLEKTSYDSHISAMIGTLFLWIFWPSFHAILLMGAQQLRAITNTLLALVCANIAASTYMFCAPLVERHLRTQMFFTHRSTLAAGAAIASTSHLKINVSHPFLLGTLAMDLSMIGYVYIQGFLAKKLRIHDTCGVFSSHALSGLLGGIAGAFCLIFATKQRYGKELYNLYPAMSPDTAKRSRGAQAAFQIGGLFCSSGFGFAGGILTGAIIVLIFPNLTEEDYYTDEAHWEEYEE